MAPISEAQRFALWKKSAYQKLEQELADAKAEIEQYKKCAFQAQEMAKEIAAKLNQWKEQANKLAEALKFV